MRQDCIDSKKCDENDIEFKRFTRLLMKIPEHTWGCDSKRLPNDWDTWKNNDLAESL